MLIVVSKYIVRIRLKTDSILAQNGSKSVALCVLFRRCELHVVIVTLNDSLCAFRADAAVVPRKHPLFYRAKRFI